MKQKHYFSIAVIVISLVLFSCMEEEAKRPRYTDINQASSWLWNEVYNKQPSQTYQNFSDCDHCLPLKIKAQIASNDTILKIIVAMEIITLKKEGPFWITSKDAHQASIIVSYAYRFYE